MTLKGETVTKINEEYKSNIINEQLRLNVGGNGFWSDHVYNDGWFICNIEDISKMITELTVMKEAIESVTGVML